MKKAVIGIDLGGSFIKVGIITQNGKILNSIQIPTSSEQGFEAILKNISHICFLLVEKTKINYSEIIAIGIGVPGLIDEGKGEVVTNANLGWKNAPIVERLKQLTNKPVFLLNDANAAVYGEYKYGNHGFNSAILLTLGTGIGSGIIKNGKLFDLNSEYGHMVIKSNGRKCRCGKRGCFERYASATALIAEAKREFKKANNPPKNRLDGKMIFSAYEQGDLVAKKVVERYIEYLSIGIVKIIDLLEPELILIGGGIASAGNLLILPLKQAVNNKLLKNNKVLKCEIMLATLGNDAGIYGAGAFAFDSLQ